MLDHSQTRCQEITLEIQRLKEAKQRAVEEEERFGWVGGCGQCPEIRGTICEGYKGSIGAIYGYYIDTI